MLFHYQPSCCATCATAPTSFSAQATSWLGGIRTSILLYAQGESSLESGEVPDVVPIGY